MTDLTSSGAHGRPKRLRAREGNLLGTSMALIVAILVLPPVWFLFKASITKLNAGLSSDGLTWDNYLRLFTSEALLGSLMNSVIFAVFATLVSLVVGGILAWLVVRTDTPFKGLAFVTTIVSLGTPYILYVTGWLYLLGRSGPINVTWKLITGRMDNLFDVNSLLGMIAIEGFLWSPLVFLLLSATFRTANAEMEEAARMSGASVSSTIWRI